MPTFGNACVFWLFLEPHLVVNLLLVSRTLYTMRNVNIDYSSIFVNNYEHKLSENSAMMDFVVLDALTGKLYALAKSYSKIHRYC